MAYCPECGSEVAPIDTFCPYCGIALQSIMPDTEEESAQASPVESSLQNPSDSNAKEDSENVEIPVSADDADKSSGNLSEDAVLKSDNLSSSPDNQNALTDWSEFDAPPQEINKSTFEGKTAMRTESFEFNLTPNQSDVEEDSAVKDEVVVADEESKISDDFQSETVPDAKLDDLRESVETEAEDWRVNPQSENAVSSAEESESKPVSEDLDKGSSDEIIAPVSVKEESEAIEEKNFAKEQPEVEDEVLAISEDDEPDFSATIPYTPPVENDEELSTEAQEDIGKGFQPLSQESSPANEVSLETENVPEPDYKIDVSQTPLPESPEPTPLYISIQPKKEATETPENKVIDPPSPLPVSNPSTAAQQEAKESRSFTSPNIGVSDTDGKKAAKLKPLDEGIVLNSRYEIVRKIGGGGMGAVYLASDQNLGGVLRAVKEMVQSYIEDEQQEKAINDFRRESMILSTLDHPSIPTIYDYFYDEKESRFYLVMKYINGGDLSARLRSAPEGRLDEKTVVEWAIQIADVLDYLHNRPTTIIYRDLKPSNVMIDGNSGRVMLIDFGIARSVNKEEKGVTAVGTMGYAPPELFSGNVEPRSDIYSLGSTIFHLLTGADPQSNPLLIFDFNKNPRPRQINSRLSDQIEQIIMRAVEYNSAQRFNSAADLRENLTKHLENLQKGTVTYGVASASSSAGAASVANVPVFCGFCGQKIAATDMFCPFCGAQQPLASQSQGLQTPSFAAPKLTARLMVIGTNELDAPEFSLEKETNLVGRRDPMSNIFPEVDLSKFDPQTKISRKHARIWRESSSYMLEDLGSSNGTVLMPTAKDSIRLLPRQPHALTHGDKIRVGDTTLHFFIG